MPSKKKQADSQSIENCLNFLNEERPLFEKNYLENGGSLKYLEWQPRLDGVGSYEPNWELIGEEVKDVPNFNEEISILAQTVSASLQGWLNSAKHHKLPDGVYPVPMQPTKAMIKKAKQEYQDDDIEDIDDKVVFAHQAMVQQYRQDTRIK